MKCTKLLFLSLIVTSLFFLYNCPTFAGRNAEIDKLKQELFELEKITKPFIETFRKVSQLVSPSVVSLSTEKKEPLKNSTDIEPLPPYQDFQPKRDHPTENIPKKGLGSGVIIDERGYILTNNHVISGFSEDEITVVTYNGEQYKYVKIVGVDPNTDLAVIKIEGENFLPAEFGDSEAVQVGDWVIAIGSPFGYQQTVSTAIATRSGGFQGVGFAISAAIAKETAENIMATGAVVRGYLGVGTHDINDELDASLGLKDKKEVISRFGLYAEMGVFVLEVWSDTPASKAGIRPGDVISEIGGKRIENTTDLQNAIRHAKVDTKIIVKVLRDGVESALDVLIERQPEDLAGKTYLAIRKLDEPTKFSLGLVVNDLNQDIAKSLGFEGEKGVLVVDVEADSPAERAGIKPGDLITKVGTKEVHSVIEFMSLMGEFLETNKPVSVFVKNKGFITLK